jgi:hypothetical protein
LASQLAQILDKARHTADPVRLMRVFGICDTTAMKYRCTAHPRTAAPATRTYSKPTEADYLRALELLPIDR